MNHAVDSKATAAFLSVDRRTLKRYVEIGALAALRLPISNALRFRQETLDNFVRSSETRTNPESKTV